MLEKPDIPDQDIMARLREAYGLETVQVTFLPIGADANTAVYRVDTPEGVPYFLKLRKGSFDPITVEVPQLLKTSAGGVNNPAGGVNNPTGGINGPAGGVNNTTGGINGPVGGVNGPTGGINSSAISAATIAPLETRSGQLWGSLDPYQMILYPFVEGQDGYQVDLTDRQWVDYGAALRGLHDTQVPAGLAMRIPRETFSAQYRDQARMYLAQAHAAPFSDPTAAKLAAFMRAHTGTIAHMLDRCDQLGLDLHRRALDFVLCHADVHPGNLHLAPTGHLYLVDWDNVIFAPKERDLMSIGAGMGSDRGQGEALFYRGYCHGDGPANIDRMALAYYRYERIIADFAAYGDQLLASSAGGADREQSYHYFTSNFLPGSVIEVAFRTDRYWMR